jgi:hypothetical protein
MISFLVAVSTVATPQNLPRNCKPSTTLSGSRPGYQSCQCCQPASLPAACVARPLQSFLMLGGEVGSAVCTGSKQGINQQGRRVTGVTVGSLGKLGDIEGRGSRFNGRLHVVVVIVGQMNGIFLSPVASTITQSISYSPFHRFSTFKFPLKPNIILEPLFPSRRESSWCRC